MIQKPNITLATKNTGRWMVLSVSGRNKKQRCRMKYILFHEPMAATLQRL